MKLYNTLTRNKDEFIPLEEGKVSMYVCGPTVYNNIHIGNARPMVAFDAVRRYFEYKGYEVTYVQNYTDIDDKIIKKANEEGLSTEEITKRYIGEVKKEEKGLRVKPATYNPKATEEIPQMIEMIEILIEKDFAYHIDGTVYFATRHFKEYGKLSKKKQEDLEAGARIAVDSKKRNPMDFVLWKPKKEGEPEWESPWGAGRPGWHIECSAMVKKYLGVTIDIHAGGTDLIFPHHENEIAQSEAVNEKPFANYWMHNGFINVDNKKMSKSKGNFFTLKEITESFSYDVIRFFMLSAHYRSPINFSKDLLKAAENGLKRIQTGAKNITHALKYSQEKELLQKEENKKSELILFREKFCKAMDDDFNTADAISAIFELIKFTNTHVTAKASLEFIKLSQEILKELCDVLGIWLEDETILDSAIEELIEERQMARKDKNFARSDQIRDELLEQKIVLEDTREGVKYRRV